MPEFTTTFSISAQHPCLPGHFPGRPVVPAVLLLQSVADALRPHFGNWAPSRVSAAKFLHPVSPEQTLVLQLDIDHTGARARFHCTLGALTVAQGELHFDEHGTNR